MAERMTNTIVELRQKFMKEIAQAKLTVEPSSPDFSELLELENFIIEKNMAPVQDMQAQGLLPQGPPQFGGMAPGGGGPGVGGLGQGINTDELARMLQQSPM
jgi:hypothetical protein